MEQWQAWLLAFGSGSGMLALLQRVWPTKAEKQTAQESLRDDLMKELGALRARVDVLDRDLAEWKDRYYTLLAEYTSLKAEVAVLRVQLNRTEKEVG